MADFKGMQVILVKTKLTEASTYDIYVVVDGTPLGLFRSLCIDFNDISGYPVLRMERVLYGEDTIQVLTPEEAAAKFHIQT